MIDSNDIIALWVTLKLAACTTVLLLIAGIPIAWWLAQTRSRFKFIIESIIALPLVLPPTVLGFYLLISFGSQGVIGQALNAMGLRPLAFTFTGLVIGSMVYSLPFVVQPLHNAFVNMGKQPLEAAATLRASPIDRFFAVALPLARPGLLTAAILGFAHTMGEFGVVLMLGGNIPGKTRVLSIAIYDHVDSMEYAQAHWLAGGLLVFSFLMLIGVYALNRKFMVVQP